MFQRDTLNSELSFFQKIKEMDYTLLICITLLSIISLLVMYSTDGGEILFHTKSHFSKLAVFFPLMIFIAFFNIRYWHTFAYLFYLLIILLLLYVSFLISSGEPLANILPCAKQKIFSANCMITLILCSITKRVIPKS